MLYRKIESLIEDHLRSNSGKILLVDGARQVGKTYGNTAQKKVPNTAECDIIKSWINK